MRKFLFSFIMLLGIQPLLWSNPIDNSPIAKISELSFDSNNKWKIELYFPYQYKAQTYDSIVIKVTDNSARLKINYKDSVRIWVITADSLSAPLPINRNGDKITVYTYSHIMIGDQSSGIVRQDELVFGNYAGATVGAPATGYSIFRVFMRINRNSLILDCVTDKSSFGSVNDTVGLGATLKGKIYDMNNKPVTALKANHYFVMNMPLTINPDGSYTTRVFPVSMKYSKLTAKEVDFEGWKEAVEIEPFELKAWSSDTVIIQDIHLKGTSSVLTGVKNTPHPESDELTLINYPNPFNMSTNFLVKIPEGLKGKAGEINIYNVNGQLIKRIVLKEGVTASWDGTDLRGNTMSSGIYYYQLNLDTRLMKSGSMILLK